MPDIKISEVARLTGLSMRYWQRRALRAWPPTFPSKNNAKRKNLTRNSRESRKTVGTVSGTAQKQQRPPEFPPAASNARPAHGRREPNPRQAARQHVLP